MTTSIRQAVLIFTTLCVCSLGVVAATSERVTLLTNQSFSRLSITKILRYEAGSVSKEVEPGPPGLFGARRMAVAKWLEWNATEAEWAPTARRPTRRIDQSGIAVVLQDKKRERESMSYVAFSLYDDYALAVVWDGERNLSYCRERCERDTAVLDAVPFVGN